MNGDLFLEGFSDFGINRWFGLAFTRLTRLLSPSFPSLLGLLAVAIQGVGAALLSCDIGLRSRCIQSMIAINDDRDELK